MAPQVVVRKRKGRRIEPVDTPGERLFDRIPNDTDVVISLQSKKNPKQVRLYYALLDFAREHSINPETGETLWGPETSDETVKIAIKYAVGAVSMSTDALTGKVMYAPHSVREMTGTEFDAFFERATYVLSERWMPPGTTPKAVRDELMLMIEGRDRFR